MRLLHTLEQERINGNTEFIWASNLDEAGANGSSDAAFPGTVDVASPLSSRFTDSDLVLILAGADDTQALLMAGRVASAAQRAAALVVGMLELEASLPVDQQALMARMNYSVDALVILPPAPDGSLMRSLLDAYIHATVSGIAGNFGPVAPIGADFLDVREIFAGRTLARIGIGYSDRTDRGHHAVDMAMANIGVPRIRRASGIMILVAGSRLLRLREIVDVADVVHANAPANVATSLGVHYDNQLGEVLRVTIIATAPAHCLPT
ncbi:hypothetical protein [Paraburkholderia sp.]|uniref:hypothetical protein n=1 Tax=Paraburkholderia sp. TaxID=1926495 RepID=UPI003D6F2507